MMETIAIWHQIFQVFDMLPNQRSTTDILMYSAFGTATCS